MTQTAPPIEVLASPERRVEDAESLLRRLDWHVVKRLDGLLQGDYRSLFLGHGYDLAEVREYQPEDDVRYIDWNVTARMDQTYVRQYVEDREISAWLLLDLSPSIDFGTAKARKRDLLVDFAGVLSRLLTRHGNKVGAMLFSSGIDDVIPPRGGQLQALRIIHQLIRPDRQNKKGVTNLGAILDRAAQTLRRRSLVFIVSDFIGGEGWEAPLGRLTEKHEVMAIWLTDPREEEIPPIGPIVLEDAETGAQVYVDTRDAGFQERFAALVSERRYTLERTFARHGIDFLRLSTDGDLVQEVARFAHLRRESKRRPVARAGLPDGRQGVVV
ncbi:MAG TPA: DUF58 domain-containing protein [Dehalococcoidia bacterium]|nr:DUF58 domain-containing protein [Dehalococcoidia bacterium]